MHNTSSHSHPLPYRGQGSSMLRDKASSARTNCMPDVESSGDIRDGTEGRSHTQHPTYSTKICRAPEKRSRAIAFAITHPLWRVSSPPVQSACSTAFNPPSSPSLESNQVPLSAAPAQHRCATMDLSLQNAPLSLISRCDTSVSFPRSFTLDSFGFDVSTLQLLHLFRVRPLRASLPTATTASHSFLPALKPASSP